MAANAVIGPLKQTLDFSFQVVVASRNKDRRLAPWLMISPLSHRSARTILQPLKVMLASIPVLQVIIL